MSKIYEVKSCLTCPHVITIDGVDLCAHKAINYQFTGRTFSVNHEKQRVNSHEFPQWCPLEDK